MKHQKQYRKSLVIQEIDWIETDHWQKQVYNVQSSSMIKPAKFTSF